MNINIVLVVVIFILGLSAIKGYRNGLVQEALSILALAVTVVALALIASAISNYLDADFGTMVMAILFFVVLMLAFNISKLIVGPVKFLSKLPIISWVNKLAGFCLGIAKGVIFIWVILAIMQTFPIIPFADIVEESILQNSFLTYLAKNNYVVEYVLGNKW